MSDGSEQADQPDNDEGTATPTSNKKMLLAVLVVSVVLGSVVGSAVIAPRVVGGGDAEAADHGADEVQGHAMEKGPLVQIENLVVNPSGSAGSRFLMVSVAFEVPDATTAELLHESSHQLRDAVATLLEQQTIEMLTGPGARDSLKSDLIEVAAPIAGDPAWMRVYLPQFVVQ